MRTNPSTLFALAMFAALLLCACGDDGGPVDAAPVDAIPPSGTFSLSWTLSDGTNPLTCSDVAAVSVAVTLVRQGGIGGVADAFTCEGGQAVSRRFSPGIYNLTVDLRASGSRSLIATPVVITDVEIAVGTDTPLPAQNFVVSPIGGFSFTVDARATAGNCVADSADGAGIVALEFSLSDGSNACVAATFDVAAGSAGSAATYTSDCTTPPAPLPCIDEDQLVTVNPIASGLVTMQITGQKAGPIDCYDRVSVFDVAGAMLVAELGSLPLTLEYSLACDPNFIPIDAGMLPDASADASVDAAPSP